MQGFETTGIDTRVMNKYIRAAVGFDKAKTFFLVKTILLFHSP